MQPISKLDPLMRVPSGVATNTDQQLVAWQAQATPNLHASTAIAVPPTVCVARNVLQRYEANTCSRCICLMVLVLPSLTACCCAGDRILTPWLTVIGKGLDGMPLVEVQLKRAGDELQGVRARVRPPPSLPAGAWPLSNRQQLLAGL